MISKIENHPKLRGKCEKKSSTLAFNILIIFPYILFRPVEKLASILFTFLPICIYFLFHFRLCLLYFIIIYSFKISNGCVMNRKILTF